MILYQLLLKICFNTQGGPFFPLAFWSEQLTTHENPKLILFSF